MQVRTDMRVGSKGLGDVVADFTRFTGIDQLVKWWSGVTGQPCGCAERQDALNAFVPEVPFT